MVALGLLMLALIIVSWIVRVTGRLYSARAFPRLCQFAAPIGFLAVLAGWTTTEVGRQPWTVNGLLHTTDSVSPSLSGGDVMISLLGYVIVYLIMYPTGRTAGVGSSLSE